MPQTSENVRTNENDDESEQRWQLFVGDFVALTKFLQSKSNFSLWILLKYIDALLRGFGQVVLSNNPISGLILIVCLAIAAPNRALSALIAGTIGLIWAVITGHRAADNYAGLTVYNPVLIGVYTEVAYPTLFQVSNGSLWIVFVLGIMISVYLTSALNGLFASCKAPCLTLPFIIVQYLIILSVPYVKPNDLIIERMPVVMKNDNPVIWYIVPENMSNYDGTSLENETSQVSPATSAPLYIDSTVTAVTTAATSTPPNTIDNVPTIAQLNNTIKFNKGKVDWNQMFNGVIHSSSQLFALEHTALACFIYLAIVIYSPLMGGCAVLGAFIGTLSGLLLVGAPVESVYSGVWGYNGLLTGAVVGGLVLVFTGQTFFATIFCIIFATLLQHALNILYSHCEALKIYNLPFNIAAILFVCISVAIPESFPRPLSFSFPEKQRYDYLKRGFDGEQHENETNKYIVVKTMKYESGANIV